VKFSEGVSFGTRNNSLSSEEDLDADLDVGIFFVLLNIADRIIIAIGAF